MRYAQIIALAGFAIFVADDSSSVQTSESAEVGELRHLREVGLTSEKYLIPGELLIADYAAMVIQVPDFPKAEATLDSLFLLMGAYADRTYQNDHFFQLDVRVPAHNFSRFLDSVEILGRIARPKRHAYDHTEKYAKTRERLEKSLQELSELGGLTASRDSLKRLIDPTSLRIKQLWNTIENSENLLERYCKEVDYPRVQLTLQKI